MERETEKIILNLDLETNLNRQNKQKQKKNKCESTENDRCNLTREQANNYRSLKIYIKTLEEEIQRLDDERTRATATIKKDEAGITTGGGRVVYDRMAELTAQYIDAQNTCEEIIKETLKEEKQIKEEINKIKDARLRNIIYKRYVQNKSFRQILLDLNERVQESTIRTMVTNFWKRQEAQQQGDVKKAY